jgi:hypothetical protein
VIASAEGLRGQLVTKFDDKLDYKLMIAPSTAAQQAAFADTVDDAPRPLSIDFQLRDGFGLVLCSQEVVLKFDAKKAAFRAAPVAAAAARTKGQWKEWAAFDRMEAEELDREEGKDVFQNNVGSDGKIASINAQGQVPCSREEYDRTASWSFSPVFPSVAEQADIAREHVNRPAEPVQSSAPAEVPAHRTAAPAARSLTAIAMPEIIQGGKRAQVHDQSAAIQAEGRQAMAANLKQASMTPAKPPAYFNIEGDDAIASFDPNGGVIETRGGRTFFFADKAAAASIATRWQDAPANIHYKCDQSAACTLTRLGGTALRVRTRG